MTNPYSSPIEDVSLPSVQRIPGPGLMHALQWLGLTAATYAMFYAVDPNFLDSMSGGGLYRYAVLYGLFAGTACLVGLFALWRAGDSWRNMVTAPGHWLVLLLGSVSVFATLIGFFQTSSLGDAPPDFFTQNYWLYRAWNLVFPLTVGVTALLVQTLASRQQKGIWRLLFAIGAFLTLVDLFPSLGITAWPTRTVNGATVSVSLSSYGQTILGIVMVLAASFADPDRERRDWVHWLGILVTLLGVISAFAWPLLHALGFQLLGE